MYSVPLADTVKDLQSKHPQHLHLQRVSTPALASHPLARAGIRQRRLETLRPCPMGHRPTPRAHSRVMLYTSHQEEIVIHTPALQIFSVPNIAFCLSAPWLAHITYLSLSVRYSHSTSPARCRTCPPPVPHKRQHERHHAQRRPGQSLQHATLCPGARPDPHGRIPRHPSCIWTSSPIS
ncbi:hypothetical protein B0H34DRAFT_269711 [Crassisporium funariophilum]|nr:hypothetical protein B0H34DRAFT_269711 [Crassisporium funariophilum]